MKNANAQALGKQAMYILIAASIAFYVGSYYGTNYIPKLIRYEGTPELPACPEGKTCRVIGPCNIEVTP